MHMHVLVYNYSLSSWVEGKFDKISITGDSLYLKVQGTRQITSSYQ